MSTMKMDNNLKKFKLNVSKLFLRVFKNKNDIIGGSLFSLCDLL